MEVVNMMAGNLGNIFSIAAIEFESITDEYASLIWLMASA